MADVKWHIGVVQMDCVVGELDPNIEKIGHFAALGGDLGLDLMVFPECATTGYFVGDKLEDLAEPPGGPTAERLCRIAAANGIHLAVGSFTRPDNAIRNSQLLFGPDGRLLATYHKAHLFAGEREICRPGDQLCLVDTDLGKIGMTICYDLIFPGYVQRLVDLGADLIINSTDWIHDAYQREVWGWNGAVTQSIASVRALENGTFVAMANRVGRERLEPDMDFDSFGHSCIAGPSGRLLALLPEGEGLATARIEIAEADLERWKSIATYKQDRRPELYA